MDLYEFDSFRFDPRTRLLLQDGREIRLSKQTGDLLSFFVERPGQVLLKDELLSGVWADTSVEDNSLTFAIHQLRTALGPREGGKSYIETLPKRGYRFVARVNKVCPTQPGSSTPLPPVLESVGDKVPNPEPALFSEGPLHIPLTRGLTGFALVGAIVLLGVVGSVFEFRLKASPRLWIANYAQLTSNGRNKGGLLTDGVRIYFLEQETEGPRLGSVAVEGGASGVLPIDLKGTVVFDISPLRSEVLVGRSISGKDAPELWIIPLLGGSPRRVGELRASSATWSHDKIRIASILGTGLFISMGDGTGTRKIATIPEGAQHLRWSPDGKILRFQRMEYRYGDAQVSIWEVNADGTSLHQLLPGWNTLPHECCGNWTPDGNFYIFESTQKGHIDFWAIPERETLFGKRSFAPMRLSSGPLDLSEPTISRDGNQLFAIGTQQHSELVRYDSTLHDFVKFLGGISATWVTFSKSGRSVAYINYPDLTVWRANADGSEEKQITFSPLQANGFSWSPDEKWLAVRARMPGHPWRIYLVPSQGGDPQPLMPGQNEQGIPTWSPDGTRLCFGDVPAVFGKPAGTEAIHIFDVRAHALSNLPGSRLLWTSRWSPDGRFISALTIEGQRLKLFDFSTNSWRFTKAAHVNTPNWTSDSKYIYYDTEPQNRTLQRVRITDGKVEQLADLHDFRGFADWWSGLSPKNEPLLLRNLSSTEIYSLALEYK